MPLHLIKLAVGCESVRELKGWVAERMATAKKKGLPLRHIHITRMTPKRDAEILAGGSLYWVIRGEIAAREKIIAIEPFRDKDGIGRCRLVMQPKVIVGSPRPMRPFQGWRYFTEDAVPPDLGHHAQLLKVLLAEDCDIRPDLREQFSDHGRDPAEEMRPEAVFETGDRGPFGQNSRRKSFRVHGFDIRMPDQFDILGGKLG